MRSKAGALGMAVAVPIVAAVAWAGAGPLPLPIVPAPTQLLAQSLYLRGTKIGSYTDDDGPFVNFSNKVINQATGSPGQLGVDDGDDWMSGDQVEYNGGFWPISKGGLDDLTYGESVEQGLDRLGQRIAAENPDETIVVVGYSQSAVILSKYKAETTRGNIVYVLVSNPARPNGGILSRFRGFTIPVLDIPLSGPAPTTSPGWEAGEDPTTFDVAQQYDGWADFPLYPLNVLATANAVLGIVYLHGNYESIVDPDTALAPGAAVTDSRTHGDTVYYTVGTDLLPLLRPLEQIGVPKPLLVALDAPLRVLVEQGYDRTLSPGESASARVLRIANPVTDLTNFVHAIPVGIDNGLEAAGYDRVLGTARAGMYGVGGPQPTPPSADAGENLARSEAPQAKTPERRNTTRSPIRGPVKVNRSFAKSLPKPGAPATSTPQPRTGLLKRLVAAAHRDTGADTTAGEPKPKAPSAGKHRKRVEN